MTQTEAKSKTRLLLLGGTTESLALAEKLAGEPGLEVVTSLAGRTVAHRLPPGEVRVGGFGGAAGLAGYLRAEDIALVVDATHPFAATISRNAALACSDTGTPRLQLQRPAWEREPGDRWLDVPNIAGAAAALPGLGHTIFLAVGRQELAAFAAAEGQRLIARMVEPPDVSGFEVVLARGPFALTDELAFYTESGIEAVVSKNSGGDATYAKIAAARRLGLPVVMIARPPAEAGDRAAGVGEALHWIATRRAAA